MIDVKYLALLLAHKKCFHGAYDYYQYYYYQLLLLLSLLNVSDSSLSHESYQHIFYPLCQRNCMLTLNSRTAERPNLLTEKTVHSLRASTSSTFLEGEYHLPGSSKTNPCGGLMHGRAVLREQKEKKKKRRHSSLKVPNTISLILFQFMRFDKEIKALLRAFQSHNVSILLKLLHLGEPLYPCHYSRKIVGIWGRVWEKLY